MIFFTREIAEGRKMESGWSGFAALSYQRNEELYRKYLRMIRPHLPESVLEFSRYRFRDCRVVSCEWREERLLLNLDTSHELTRFPHRYVQLAFAKVRQKPRRLPRRGEWWRAEELHLGGRNNFCLHVAFTSTEVEILSDEIKIATSHRRSFQLQST